MKSKLQLFVCLFATLLFTRVMVAQVAHVFVSTSKGTGLYDASSTGKLTLVSGSPFTTPSGLTVGTNGKYFINVGTDYVHTYSVAANGAIGKQVSEINTQSYGGAECGTTNGATLDHTGSYVYVSLNGALESGDQFCATIQTFQISSSGVLTFKGDTVLNTFKEIDTPPVVSGNDTFAYNLQQVSESCELMINGFTRESSGTLELSSISETDPPTQPNVWAAYIPALMTADPTNHLAVAMYPTNGPCGPTGPFQLASFTEESQGDIKSTNTWRNMPALAGGVNAMRMSPAGNLLAVATGAGVQIFHFNGANPITKYTGVLGTGGISYLYWDNSNHLFAAGGTKLHVFTVTTTSAVEAPGSPYTIPSGVSALVVRPL